MLQISDKDRMFLQSLKLCLPYDNSTNPFRPHGLRVLVPNRFMNLFSGFEDRNGSLITTNFQHHVVNSATQMIGRPYYRRASPEHVARRMNCSTFTKEIFAQVGIHLPRYSIDQSYVGTRVEDPQAGDLLFFENHYPITDLDRSVGHVAFVAEGGIMIHGTPQLGSFIVEPILSFSHVQRIIPAHDSVLVILPVKPLGLETALDVVRWMQRPEGPKR